jgi:hypothetical protein
MGFEGENSEILTELSSGRSTGVGQIFCMGRCLCITVRARVDSLPNDADFPSEGTAVHLAHVISTEPDEENNLVLGRTTFPCCRFLRTVFVGTEHSLPFSNGNDMTSLQVTKAMLKVLATKGSMSRLHAFLPVFQVKCRCIHGAVDVWPTLLSILSDDPLSEIHDDIAFVSLSTLFKSADR